jgi:hypothetical protein
MPMPESFMPAECTRDIERVISWINPIALDERIRQPKAALIVAIDCANRALAERWPNVLPYCPPRNRLIERSGWRYVRLLTRLGYLIDGRVPL